MSGVATSGAAERPAAAAHRRARLPWIALQDGTVFVCLADVPNPLRLSAPAALLWDLCAEPRTTQALVGLVAAEVGAAPEQLVEHVRERVAELAGLGVLESVADDASRA